MSSPLLSITEGAENLNVKPGTVRAWILQKRIPFLKLGGRVFLRRSDIEALIAGTVSVKPASPRKPALRGVSGRAGRTVPKNQQTAL